MGTNFNGMGQPLGIAGLFYFEIGKPEKLKTLKPIRNLQKPFEIVRRRQKRFNIAKNGQTHSLYRPELSKPESGRCEIAKKPTIDWSV